MTDIKKEGDGGGGFGDSGGTAFTSTDAGIFTPTHSDRGTRKKNNKKSRTGVDRLADFIDDNSPERKMSKSEGVEAITDLIKWVTIEMRKNDAKGFRQQNSGTEMNDQIPRIDWDKKKDMTIPEDKDDVLEFDGEPSEQAAEAQDSITDRIKQLDDSDDSDKPKDTGAASDAAPAGVNVQLAMPSAAVQYDSLGQGGSKDTKQYEEVEEPEIEGAEVEEDEPKDEINKLFKLLDKF